MDVCIDCLCRASALLSLLISLELLWLYLTDSALIAGGKIIKERIVFGWGIWNTAGSILASTIPLFFLGAVRSGKMFYLLGATVAYVSAILTLSRNALILSTVIYFLCLFIAIVRGNIKRQARAFACTIAIAATSALAKYSRPILSLLGDYIDRGLSDNGRLALWRAGILDFLSAPLFGRGFFGTSAPPDFASSLPGMLHSTPIQLLASSGIFGTLSYLFYRAETLAIALRPTPDAPAPHERFLLSLPLISILLGSLIDNFVFYPHQMLLPSLALAIICLANAQNKNKDTI